MSGIVGTMNFKEALLKSRTGPAPKVTQQVTPVNFGAVDIRTLEGYKAPVPKVRVGPIQPKKGAKPQATVGAIVFQEEEGLETDIPRGCSKVYGGDFPQTPLGYANYQSAWLDMKLTEMLKSKVRSEVEKWNFCQRVHEGELKASRLELSRARIQNELKTVLSLQQQKDTEIAELKEKLKLQAVKLEEAECHSNTKYTEMVAQYENKLQELRLNGKCLKEAQDSQETKVELLTSENQEKLTQIKKLTEDNEVLQDVCFALKKKTRGIFGKKMGNRNTEVDKMVKKIKAKEEKKREEGERVSTTQPREETGCFARFRKSMRGGSEQLEEVAADDVQQQSDLFLSVPPSPSPSISCLSIIHPTSPLLPIIHPPLPPSLAFPSSI